ncbi:hypothetical protein [Bacillus sp. REN3]|uniref:hypothetical protein n=1 Tax=Bacillus sp. REN3 TaxID=2802440 RepID=UPI001AEE0818|nr:hypothetical protein [Bacillus sp. REN3]
MEGIKLDEIKKALSLLSQSNEPVEAAIDLHDIQESCVNLGTLMEEIKSIQDKQTLMDKLTEIEIELDHINWHYKSLKKGLKILYKLN